MLAIFASPHFSTSSFLTFRKPWLLIFAHRTSRRTVARIGREPGEDARGARGASCSGRVALCLRAHGIPRRAPGSQLSDPRSVWGRNPFEVQSPLQSAVQSPRKAHGDPRSPVARRGDETTARRHKIKGALPLTAHFVRPGCRTKRDSGLCAGLLVSPRELPGKLRTTGSPGLCVGPKLEAKASSLCFLLMRRRYVRCAKFGNKGFREV